LQRCAFRLEHRRTQDGARREDRGSNMDQVD